MTKSISVILAVSSCVLTYGVDENVLGSGKVENSSRHENHLPVRNRNMQGLNITDNEGCIFNFCGDHVNFIQWHDATVSDSPEVVDSIGDNIQNSGSRRVSSVRRSNSVVQLSSDNSDSGLDSNTGVASQVDEVKEVDYYESDLVISNSEDDIYDVSDDDIELVDESILIPSITQITDDIDIVNVPDESIQIVEVGPDSGNSGQNKTFVPLQCTCRQKNASRGCLQEIKVIFRKVKNIFFCCVPIMVEVCECIPC